MSLNCFYCKELTECADYDICSECMRKELLKAIDYIDVLHEKLNTCAIATHTAEVTHYHWQKMKGKISDKPYEDEKDGT